MKSKLLIYILPALLVSFLIYGYSIQDDPRNDSAPVTTETTPYVYSGGQDTTPPANFPYPQLWNFNYSADPGPASGTVGATYFQGRYYLNKWNTPADLYKYNATGPNGGMGTLTNIINGYNGGSGAIRDMTVAPDGSGTFYLWGGSASTALYKLDSAGTRIKTFTHAGAAYRAITWDPNRKGFWSCNFSDNIVCRDTNGTIIKTLTNTLAGKYGMGFDSSSSADSAFLWVWSQGTGVNELHRIHINSNTSKTYLFPLVGGLGIAGGAECFVKDNQLVLALNWQNFAVTAYKLKDLSPPPTGGNITVRNHHLRAIPDNGGNANPALDTIYISGIPSGNFIQKMTVTIDSVIHTWIGDLRFWVTRTSTADTIISRPGWTGTGFGNSCDNFIGTRLLDTTGAGILNIQNITPPTCGTGLPANSTGNFTPKSPLQVFTNQDPNGAYILRISDNAGGDEGNLHSWTISIDYGPMVGVPSTVEVVQGYKLSQNYPNPFNPATKISYSIPEAGMVTLKIFDILGKEVATLVSEFKGPGSHEAVFNGSNFSSGVYFYRIESGKFIDTKKMFLLK